MSDGDEAAGPAITVLDRTAFAASARLAAMIIKGYQQDFIHLECLS
ncbi:hypothetical protein V0M98_06615 [Pseudomonas silesiensis]|jgi:hypothetical protein